jgi:hypothetical protein
MGIALCALAFLVTFIAARRSTVAGLSSVLTVGYFYGILRANYPQAASHFIFDAAVLALYAARLFQRQEADIRIRTRAILPWLAMLVAWPALMVLAPMQDWAVQLVGLRGAVFLLPLLLFGARLSREEMHRIAINLAVLNLLAFIFTAAEYRIGIQPFFPRNANTELIYRSADVGDDQFRIPSTFTGSHAYAGTMAMTMPLLLGAWVLPGLSRRKRMLLFVAMIATILGVFAAASRVHTIALGVIIVATLLSGRIRLQTRAVLFAMIGLIGLVVVSQQRLQRFTTLQDSGMVVERVGSSVNLNFFELLVEYPFGNGLGGGGTSLPFFLQDRVRNHIAMENEYAHIMLEQTVIGLLLWIAFIIWFLSRRFTSESRFWELSEQLAWTGCAVYFGTGLIGTGLLTSIPHTMLIMMCAGWVTSPKQLEEEPVMDSELEYAAT